MIKMKFKYLLTVIALVFACQTIKAKSNMVDTTFTVDGVCGMCKDRIENALSVKGVKMAEWSIESHELHIVYNSDKITIDEIGSLLNAVGHDSDISKASDEEYNAIHGCCKYRKESDSSTSSCSGNANKSCSKKAEGEEASTEEKKSCCSSTTTTTTTDSTAVSKSCCKGKTSCKDKEKK